jgi:ABC-2 type transport system permease protein
MKAVENLAMTPPSGTRMFGLLVELRLRLLRNTVVSIVTQSRLRVVLAVTLLAVIWTSLFSLYAPAIAYLERSDLVGPVVMRYMFAFFFVTLLVMLTFSGAVLSYSGLFFSGEPPYLLCTPVDRRLVALAKYIEALFFASWSLVLLGVPLIAAMGLIRGEPWPFYPFFILFFLAFVMIPGALGLLIAAAVGRFLARGGRRLLIAVMVALGAAVFWSARDHWIRVTENPEWIDRFLEQVSFIRGSMLPSMWVAHGISAVSDGRIGDAVFFLLVLVSNGFMASWLAVEAAGRWLIPAYDRVHSARKRPVLLSSRAPDFIAAVFLWWVPPGMKQIILKDLRTFIRDPLQWSQLAIFLGLLVLYVVNIPALGVDSGGPHSKHLLAFLNMAAMCLILATFTARFVYPLVSLEGRRQWVLGMAPLSIRRILWSKQIYSVLLTGASALAVTVLSARAIKMTIAWQAAYLIISLAAAWGLSGISIGLGARYAVSNEPSGAKIASGFGGAVNLVGTLVFIALVVLIVGLLNAHAYRSGSAFPLDVWLIAGVVAAIILAIGAAHFAMTMGARRLERMDF